MSDSLRGSLLVAAPTLIDPNFRRTVVLLAEHSDEGAMGLVLNRPTDTSVADALPDLGTLAGEGRPSTSAGRWRSSRCWPSPSSMTPPTRRSCSSARSASFRSRTCRSGAGRVFVGYAGWTGGQLEAELEEEAWFVVPAEPDDLFDDEPDELWSAVLRRQGGPYAVLALMPPDPSLN